MIASISYEPIHTPRNTVSMKYITGAIDTVFTAGITTIFSVRAYTTYKDNIHWCFKNIEHQPAKFETLCSLVSTKLRYIIKKLNVLWLQKTFVYPGLHPLLQCPVCLLHGESSAHSPLQLLMQACPKVPSIQPTIINVN